MFLPVTFSIPRSVLSGCRRIAARTSRRSWAPTGGRWKSGHQRRQVRGKSCASCAAVTVTVVSFQRISPWESQTLHQKRACTKALGISAMKKRKKPYMMRIKLSPKNLGGFPAIGRVVCVCVSVCVCVFSHWLPPLCHSCTSSDGASRSRTCDCARGAIAGARGKGDVKNGMLRE